MLGIGIGQKNGIGTPLTYGNTHSFEWPEGRILNDIFFVILFIYYLFQYIYIYYNLTTDNS